MSEQDKYTMKQNFYGDSTDFSILEHKMIIGNLKDGFKAEDYMDVLRHILQDESLHLDIFADLKDVTNQPEKKEIIRDVEIKIVDEDSFPLKPNICLKESIEFLRVIEVQA